MMQKITSFKKTGFSLLIITCLLLISPEALNAQYDYEMPEVLAPTEQIDTQFLNSKIDKNIIDTQNLEKQIDVYKNLESTRGRIDTLINIFSALSTLIIGMGGLLVWNGFSLRQEAQKDLSAIKELKQQAFATHQEAANTMRDSADKAIKLLVDIGVVKEKASRDGHEVEAIKEATNEKAIQALDEYDKSKTHYSNVTAGTAAYLSPSVSVSASRSIGPIGHLKNSSDQLANKAFADRLRDLNRD